MMSLRERVAVENALKEFGNLVLEVERLTKRVALLEDAFVTLKPAIPPSAPVKTAPEGGASSKSPN